MQYNWRRRRVGYTRLITADQVKSAMQSVHTAKRLGMQFKIQKVFIGIKIIVVVEMPYKSDPRDLI
ncbi:hypothetical protein KAR91_35270 [Candidatus Pacearchaeota archaeon]|nr:hypothetical protein [Candidatus Pacearchaeota archaeon]